MRAAYLFRNLWLKLLTMLPPILFVGPLVFALNFFFFSASQLNFKSYLVITEALQYILNNNFLPTVFVKSNRYIDYAYTKNLNLLFFLNLLEIYIQFYVLQLDWYKCRFKKILSLFFKWNFFRHTIELLKFICHAARDMWLLQYAMSTLLAA